MLYKILKPIVAVIFRILFRIRVKGAENVPATGSVLLCSNHISITDCVFIGISISPAVSFLGKSELRRLGPISTLFKALGYIPITRGKADVGAVKNVIDTLLSGKSVLVFIQGTRRRGVALEDTGTKNGAALMQRKAECDVVPISITNEKMRVGLFSKVNVNIGKPISNDELSKLNYDEATARIFSEIIRLSKEEV